MRDALHALQHSLCIKHSKWGDQTCIKLSKAKNAAVQVGMANALYAKQTLASGYG